MKLILPNNTSELYYSELPIITLQAEEKYVKGKASYLYDSNFLQVEEFVAKVLNENGFKCISGVKIRQIYSYLNFSQSISESYESLITRLKNDKQFGKTFHGQRLQELHIIKKKLIEERNKVFEYSELNPELISIAQAMYKGLRYAANENIENESSIFDLLHCRPKDEIIGLMKFFDHINGLLRGTPDLFVYSDDEFYFVEVKSDKDALSKWQICFIHFFREMIGENIKVIHVVNKNW